MSNSNIGNKQPSLRKPVVLMTMGSQERKGHDYQVMTHKYITPLVEFSDCVPVLVPTCCGIEDLETYLDMADGVYLTGAGSNIDPALYGQENETPGKGQDQNRDLFDIPLVKAAIKRGLPIFGICRGMQEINVALGGDIYQKVYAEPGFNDHRENPEDPVEVQYAQVHGVKIKPDSWLRDTRGYRRDSRQLAAWPRPAQARRRHRGHRPRRRRPGRGDPCPEHLAVPVRRAVAPGVASGEEPGFDQDFPGFRRRLPGPGTQGADQASARCLTPVSSALIAGRRKVAPVFPGHPLLVPEHFPWKRAAGLCLSPRSFFSCPIKRYDD
ncbi:peptidase C26 [Pseudomonas putida S11]|nr:peptidase C26 [Pseudomonas putida S11]